MVNDGGTVSSANADNTQESLAGTTNSDHLRKIFVGGLDFDTSEDALKTYFSQYGQVVDAVVMRESRTHRSRCFGFITFATEQGVDAVQNARPHYIDEKLVETKRAQPRGEYNKSDFEQKIFLGGLKDCHDEENLKKHFSQFGYVTKVKILLDKTTGRNRGFGFLEFFDADAVEKAISQKRHSICYSFVEVKKCVHKSELYKKNNGPNDNSLLPSTYNSYALARKTVTDSGYYVPSPQVPSYYTMPYYGSQAFATPVQPITYNTSSYATTTEAYPATAYDPQAYSYVWPQNSYSTTAQEYTRFSNQLGNYHHQAYNGGPQKPTYLQNKRVYPYGNNATLNNGELLLAEI